MTRSHGFTLVELVVTLAVVAVLAAAIPALTNFVRENRMITALTQFRGQLMLSRSLAIRTATEVVLCKRDASGQCTRNGGWEQGWMVFSDPDGNRQCLDLDRDGFCDGDGGKLFTIVDATLQGLAIKATGNPGVRGYVRFTPIGDASGFLSTFSFCDHRGGQDSRGLKLIMTGRVVAAKKGDPLLRCP